MLLASARVNPDPGAILAIARSDADWVSFATLCTRHGLRALAYRSLALSDAPVPAEVLGPLWAAHTRRERINRRLMAELRGIVTALEANGIPCLPYKGPTLAVWAYGDIALREFGDIDVLVRAVDIERARAALEALGYVREFEISEEAQRSMIHAREHYHLVMRGSSGIVVELHWRTDPDFPVERDDEAWWKSLPRRDFAASSMRSFEATDLMLVLLLHGSKHHWASLHWLVDVAELARREAIDWERLQARADSLHARRRVDLGLLLARDLLDAPVPAIEPHPAVAALAADLAREALGVEAPVTATRLLARNLALFERTGERARHVVQVVFTPTLADWMRWRLPRPLFFLYLPLRLARLAGKHARLALSAPHPRSRIAATPRTPPPRPRSTD